ncbi:MAG: hypothetical protein A07HR60_00330 [uncultured archaeon A07HR60]|nr:MAG: hypothetical protein A07HR60_00330 [uncultured archaeon A07HR60]
MLDLINDHPGTRLRERRQPRNYQRFNEKAHDSSRGMNPSLLRTTTIRTFDYNPNAHKPINRYITCERPTTAHE